MYFNAVFRNVVPEEDYIISDNDSLANSLGSGPIKFRDSLFG